MFCCECGAKEMRWTTESIDEVVKGVMTHVEGIPHWKCDACGNFVMYVEDATVLSKEQLRQAGCLTIPATS